MVKRAETPQRHVLPPTMSKRDWRHTLTEKCWCKPVVVDHDQWTGEPAS